MTSNENLLVVAMEECAEIQQAVSEAIRFGVGNSAMGEMNTTNGRDIVKEFEQLRAVINMLRFRRVLPAANETEAAKIYHDKLDSINGWEEYSRSIGRITD